MGLGEVNQLVNQDGRRPARPLEQFLSLITQELPIFLELLSLGTGGLNPISTKSPSFT